MSPDRLRILTDGLTALAQVIIAARTDRDAAALVHQLRAMGPAQRADVGRVEAERMEELSSMLPPVTPIGGQLGPLDDEGD